MMGTWDFQRRGLGDFENLYGTKATYKDIMIGLQVQGLPRCRGTQLAQTTIANYRTSRHQSGRHLDWEALVVGLNVKRFLLELEGAFFSPNVSCIGIQQS